MAYTKPTLTGYNANPPSDDGAQTAMNRVDWAKHIEKIGNPLRVYADAINNGVSTALDGASEYHPTIAAMTAITSPEDGRIVTVTEAGRGGLFVFDTSLTASANLGTTFKAGDLTTGSWARRFSGPVDVRWFGAVSGADSTTALNNAAALGKDIYISHGDNYNYNNLSGSITIATAGMRVFGGGKITALDDANHVFSVTADECVIDGIAVQGDGTFTADKLVANASRIALIKVTGDNCRVLNCHLINGPQNFIDFNGVTGGLIDGNIIEGGIATYNVSTDTGYQGILVVGSTDVQIVNNRVIRSASNGYPAEGIYAGNDGVTTPQGLVITSNSVEDSWDHAIYANNGVGYTVSGNVLRSDSVPLVVAGADISGGSVQGHTVIGNVVTVSTKTAGSGVSGIYLRDANGCVVDSNIIHECPRGIYVSPVTYSGASSTISDNAITNNTVKGWTDQGILVGKSGQTLGGVSRNIIQGNSLVCDTTNAQNTAAAISMGIGQEAAANIAFDNLIAGNTINGSGDAGISIQYHTGTKIEGNVIVNPTEAATPTLYAGIMTQDCTGLSVCGNSVRDTNGTAKMRSGIDGNNTTTATNYCNNAVKNNLSAYAAIRRTQQASSGNSHRGNRTGDNSLTGVLTLANASTTTVSNDNWNYNLGHTSYIVLTPTNALAAGFSPWLAISSGTNRVSFVLNHSAAAGTEQFFYEIVQ